MGNENSKEFLKNLKMYWIDTRDWVVAFPVEMLKLLGIKY